MIGVWSGTQRVGTLTPTDSGNPTFEYDPTWLLNASAFPLAPGLPLVGGIVASPAVRSLFENLLPEGLALDAAARAAMVSKDNWEGLLLHLGAETTGALTFLLDPASPDQIEGALRPLLKTEVGERLAARAELPFCMWDGKARASITGTQDKLMVFELMDHWALVDGIDFASTHIIKPGTGRDASEMVSNEYFCMTLAKRVGLAAAEVRLEKDPTDMLVVERFDRVAHPAGVERLHVIDACQALGLRPSTKLERPFGVEQIRTGASLPRLFTMLQKEAVVPARARLDLLQWTVFQILIGNTDAHAKNLSFFITRGGVVAAPAYDLACHLLYGTESLAMAIGDQFDPCQLSPSDWALMAQQSGLHSRQVGRVLKRMALEVLTVIEEVAEAALAVGAHRSTIKSIAQVVRGQCALSLAVADDVDRVDCSPLEECSPQATTRFRPLALAL